MNQIYSLMFFAQAIAGPAGDKGTQLVLWLTGFCCFVLIAVGAISFAAHQNIIAVGLIVGAVVIAACGLSFVNFLFAGIPAHLTAGGGTIIFLWR